MKRLLTALYAIPLLALPPSLYGQSAPPTHAFNQRIEAFVKGAHEHGVPYSGARALGPGALPTLRSWLKEDVHRPHWAAIIATIGYIGDPGDFDVLRDFVATRFSGEIDENTFNAMLSSMYAIGYIATRSADAMVFLKTGTDPASYGTLRWSYRIYRGEKLGLLLSKFAINALSITGRPEVNEILEELEKAPFDERQLSNIREGLGRHREITRSGRDAYLEAAERRGRF